MSTYSATYPSHRLIVSTLVTPRWVDRLVAAAGMMDPHAPSQRERRGGKAGGEEEKKRRGEKEREMTISNHNLFYINAQPHQHTLVDALSPPSPSLSLSLSPSLPPSPLPLSLPLTHR